MKLNRMCTLMLVLATVLAIDAAVAQGIPSKTVRLVVPFSAGSSGDTVARTLAQPLSRALGQSVIVDNHPGGAGTIGGELVARSPADGHTLLLRSGVFAINPALRRKLPYDTLKDFAGVARIASNPMVISVHPSLPARTVKELVALARAHPGQLTYATQGSASPMHLAMESFKTVARADIIHTPYQGGAAATMAALTGHTGILVVTVSQAAPHAAASKLRALAVTSLLRSDTLKDVPTVAESGFSGFEMSLWYGAWVPAATPKQVIDRLDAEITRALRAPEAKESLGKLGLSTAAMGPGEFDAFFRAEARRYEKIVKEANIKID